MDETNGRKISEIVDTEINLVEITSNLAHTRTLYESGDICNNEDDMFLDIEATELTYTEEIQDRFNYWYDFYYEQILQCI